LARAFAKTNSAQGSCLNRIQKAGQATAKAGQAGLFKPILAILKTEAGTYRLEYRYAAPDGKFYRKIQSAPFQ